MLHLPTRRASRHPERNTYKTLIHGGGPTHFGYLTTTANRTPTRLEIYPPTTKPLTRTLLNTHRHLTPNNPALLAIYLVIGTITYLTTTLTQPKPTALITGLTATALIPALAALAGLATKNVHSETLLIVPTPGNKRQPLPNSLNTFLARLLDLEETKYGPEAAEDGLIWALGSGRLPHAVHVQLMSELEAEPAMTEVEGP